MKSYARFIPWPKDGREFKVSEPLAITGVAQSGMSGLTKVQTWLKPKDEALPSGDPYFTSAPWRDAEVLPPPPTPMVRGASALERLPPVPSQFDKDGTPLEWPLRNTITHWATLLPAVAAGEYETALPDHRSQRQSLQPMPRPL